MQRCHEQDLSGHLLEQGGWDHLCLPAEYEGPRRATSIGLDRPEERAGRVAVGQRFGSMELDDLKRSLGSYAAAGRRAVSGWVLAGAARRRVACSAPRADPVVGRRFQRPGDFGLRGGTGWGPAGSGLRARSVRRFLNARRPGRTYGGNWHGSGHIPVARLHQTGAAPRQLQAQVGWRANHLSFGSRNSANACSH